MRLRKHPVLVLVLLALCGLGLTACGKSSSGTSTQDNGIASQSPQQIIDTVKSALRKAGTFHLSGSGSSNGDLFTVDVRVDTTKNNAKGKLGLNGQQLELVTMGDIVYVKAPAAFYESSGVPHAQATLVADKWLKSPASNSNFTEFTEFTDVDKLLTPDGAVTKGETTTINGQAALTVIDSKGTDGEGTLFVRTTGDPLPVQIKGGGKASGSLNFDDFGTPVDVAAPAGAVDLSQLTG